MSSYIYDKLKADKSDGISVKLIIEKKSGSTVSISYDGSVEQLDKVFGAIKDLENEVWIDEIWTHKNPDIQWALSELERIKEQAAIAEDENLANNCWRESEALQLTLTYIKAFHKLKSADYREAWYDLEQCEIKCKIIARNSSEEFCLAKIFIL